MLLAIVVLVARPVADDPHEQAGAATAVLGPAARGEVEGSSELVGLGDRVAGSVGRFEGAAPTDRGAAPVGA